MVELSSSIQVGVVFADSEVGGSSSQKRSAECCDM